MNLEINTKQNNICNNAHKHYFFWENKIIKDCSLWEGYFENEAITKNSKIVYTGILNYEKNILHQGFAVYPSVYKLLGFLQHVFLPTAFFSWFDRDSQGFYIPLSNFHNVVDEVVKYTDNIDLDLVNRFKNSYTFLNKLWVFDETLISFGLKSFCEKFNTDWNIEPDQKLFLNIFDTPADTFDFIKNSIGWSDYDEFVEEEISMSLDTLKFTCDNALSEPLLNRKFVDILNINMPILF